MIRKGLRSYGLRLAGIWRQLTEPTRFVKDEEQRQQSRLLSSLLLILIIVILVILPLRYLLETPPSLGKQYIPLMLLSSSYLVTAYILSRRGYYRIGSSLIVIGGTLTIFVAAVLGKKNGSGNLYYLICIILFSSLFFRVRFIIVLSIFHVGIMLIFPMFVSNANLPPFLDSQITFNLVMTVVILLFAEYREHLETSRQRRLTESESRARSAETYFRLIFQHSPDAILLLDPHEPEWPIIDCNDETCRINGYKREELIGKGIDILHPAPTTPEAKADNLKLLRSKGIIEFEATHRRRDGTLFTIHNSSAVINLDERELVLGIDRDITDRKLAEQRQLDLTVEREQTSILSNFIRDASHEFRTPLSIIKTNLYLLTKTPEKQDRYISGIIDQADAILRLVESLVTMARLDTDPGFHALPIDINQTLGLMITSRQSKIDEAGVHVSLALMTDLPLVRGDISGLSEAFQHILDNALRYTSSGGEILIRTYLEANCIVVEIHDTGSGIEAKDLPHIFERFYRVDHARSTRGLGLGLSIAHKIIQKHKGQIEVESEVGKGSLFRVMLPTISFL